uniref:F-box domain-containing protein n=2 Tax=Hordeum vulgare subsp. vulgare TaxID=112509 RepID=A0A8I6ZEU3_HORVV
MRRSRMPDRRGAAVLDDLPDDIVVGKILILLPPKDIGRCRVVRKSWRSATSTPGFMVEHRRRQPSLPIIDGNGRPASFVTLRAAVAGRATNQQIWPFPSQYPKPMGSGLWLRASSDGFLIVWWMFRDRFYICNPTTRKHALLPLPGSSCVHGLYEHKSTGEYRVLWSIIHAKQEEATLYVLTVGAKESRSIQVVLPTLPSPSQKQMYQLIYHLRCELLRKPPPVHHCGSLHWIFGPNLTLGGSSTQGIIVFDTEAESFRWMRNPPTGTGDLMYKRLFDMEGTLAFVCTKSYNTAKDVWVMQDYEAETWAFKYRIDVSMRQASRPLESTSPKDTRKTKRPLDSTVTSFGRMTPLNEHELLVSFNYNYVLRSNTDDKLLGVLTIYKRRYCMKLTGHRLQESIMPIPSGEMQGEDEELPFSMQHV